MTFILLSAEQAERVRYSDPGVSGLNPIERSDGQFFLGIECLSDPRFGQTLTEWIDAQQASTYEGPDGAKWRESTQLMAGAKVSK